eukprot:TRINITY_DN7859_c0_g1_i1.p1 TRINITY_DN7859_c0_g1~~TRINITY_DN7859_c0_g1_i1.p1  ORF type:complete len:185 (+),score=26.16 TRINITY_DN7859_c0_g1_i1:44-598(+)
MSRSQSYSISFHFHRIELSKVRAFYCSLERMTEIHPMMVKVEEVPIQTLTMKYGEEQTIITPSRPGAPTSPTTLGKAYQITDSFSLSAFLPQLTLVYDTLCTLDVPEAPTNDLIFRVWTASGITLDQHYQFVLDEDGTGCILTENTTATGSGFGWLLVDYAVSQAKQAHEESFRALFQMLSAQA